MRATTLLFVGKEAQPALRADAPVRGWLPELTDVVVGRVVHSCSIRGWPLRLTDAEVALVEGRPIHE